ncbi:MAG: hypothetical protein WBB08_01660 [Halobacteriota archaeon]
MKKLWEEGYVIIVARKRKYQVERYVQMGILFVGAALSGDLDPHLEHAHYVGSL